MQQYTPYSTPIPEDIVGIILQQLSKYDIDTFINAMGVNSMWHRICREIIDRKSSEVKRVIEKIYKMDITVVSDIDSIIGMILSGIYDGKLITILFNMIIDNQTNAVLDMILLRWISKDWLWKMINIPSRDIDILIKLFIMCHCHPSTMNTITFSTIRLMVIDKAIRNNDCDALNTILDHTTIIDNDMRWKQLDFDPGSYTRIYKLELGGSYEEYRLHELSNLFRYTKTMCDTRTRCLDIYPIRNVVETRILNMHSFFDRY